jgi:hypothetical protein
MMAVLGTMAGGAAWPVGRRRGQGMNCGQVRCRLRGKMICPQCKAEYRQGFTRCADCDVELVYELPATKSDAAETSQAAPADEADEDPFCSFWQGDDPRLHAELCAVFDDAGIQHKTVRRQDHLFNLSNYPAFQIGVPFSLYEKAETAVKEAFDLDPSNPRAVETLSPPFLLPQSPRSIRKLPYMLALRSDENIPGPPTDGNLSDEQSEEATAEVWTGDDHVLRDMLIASLRENQIPVRQGNAGDKISLFVRPEDEDRTREIVREIVEGAPPE